MKAVAPYHQFLLMAKSYFSFSVVEEQIVAEEHIVAEEQIVAERQMVAERQVVAENQMVSWEKALEDQKGQVVLEKVVMLNEGGNVQ